MKELNDLEWVANWKQDNLYYCRLFSKRKPVGFTNWLEHNFGANYGGWQWDVRRQGVEVWFKQKEDMLTLKMLTQTDAMAK